MPPDPPEACLFGACFTTPSSAYLTGKPRYAPDIKKDAFREGKEFGNYFVNIPILVFVYVEHCQNGSLIVLQRGVF